MTATKQYQKRTEVTLAETISRLTGIKLEKLEKNGVKFALEHTASIEATPAQLCKVELLKSVISQYNEMIYIQEDVSLSSSSKVGEYFLARLKGVVDRERFEVAFLSSQNKIIMTETLFTGTVDESPIYPRDVVKAVLKYDATNIILSHNHPGGSLRASNADIDVTHKIRQALAPISVKVLDHVIIAGDKYFSFAEQGMID